MFFLLKSRVHNEPRSALAGMRESGRERQRQVRTESDENETAKPLAIEDLPLHVKVAATELTRLAAAAKLYNYNGQITGFREDKHPLRKGITNLVIETPTHGASFINGRMDLVFSLYDGSDERRKPAVVSEWYKCTGAWTKEEAIQEALAILQRWGDTETLQAVLPGKKEYRATEMGNIARTPDGQRTTVRPFPKVDLYDTNGTRRVGIEFRMGSTGVAGVTRFWRWP